MNHESKARFLSARFMADVRLYTASRRVVLPLETADRLVLRRLWSTLLGGAIGRSRSPGAIRR